MLSLTRLTAILYFCNSKFRESGICTYISKDFALLESATPNLKKEKLIFKIYPHDFDPTGCDGM
jgi:hypothetical protein